MGKFIDITGKKFGRLTVISEAGKDKNGKIMWLCQCKCGTQKKARGGDLQKGAIRSCGCLKKEIAYKRAYKHGMTDTPILRIWKGTMQRCNNPNDPSYRNYGARGIKVCERWDKFENFYADMGNGPKGLTIERIDNDGNYEPSNCKWATRKEQARNKRNNRIIKYGGRSKCVSAWAEEIGMNYRTLLKRLNTHPPQIAFNM